MRTVNIGTEKYSRVVCLDEPGAGGACHEYKIQNVVKKLSAGTPRMPDIDFGIIHFQNGPVKEAGVNGCHQEDLLAIVIDRLQHFQAGGFACRENAIALTHCEDALHWLRHRTNKRVERNVEGTSQL